MGGRLRGSPALQVATAGRLRGSLVCHRPSRNPGGHHLRDPGRLAGRLASANRPSATALLPGALDTIIPQARQVADADAMAKQWASTWTRPSRDFYAQAGQAHGPRGRSAEDLGVIRPGVLYELMRFIERPSCSSRRPRPLQAGAMAGISGGLHVADNNGDGQELDPRPAIPPLRRGAGGEAGARAAGPCSPCRIPGRPPGLPPLHRRHVMDAAGWINLLADPAASRAVPQPHVPSISCRGRHPPFYREFPGPPGLQRFTEALVTGQARILGYRRFLRSAISLRRRLHGGGLRRKIRLAGEVALRRQWPLVSVCCSGGARLYEGFVASCK